jgi:hypothetical protein
MKADVSEAHRWLQRLVGNGTFKANPERGPGDIRHVRAPGADGRLSQSMRPTYRRQR